MFFNWLDGFIRKEATEESQLSQQHTEVNIFDSKAEGDHIRSAALDLYGTENGALLELTWHPSSYKMFSKEYTSLQDAQNVFNEIKAKMLDINKQILEGEMEGAEQASKALLEELASMSNEPLQQSTNQPVTQTQAGKKELIQISILIPALNKEAKATVQNIFFSDVQELLQWQEAQKAAQPKPEGLPGTMPGGTSSTLPPMGDPNAKGPLVDTPAKPSALEQMVDQRVEEKIESSLDAKARAVFENVHAETVKVLRQLGRSWEEIKDFFNRYLKYDWDDIDVYLDQFIKAENGLKDPGTEKVKDELAEGEGQPEAPTKEEFKPEVLPKPEILPAASKKPTVEKKALLRSQDLESLHYLLDRYIAEETLSTEENESFTFCREVVSVKLQETLDTEATQEVKLDKKAELVRYPDSLKKGDQVKLVRSIMTKENLILQPEVSGRIVQANEYSIVIQSSEGRFTISRHECTKLDKTASLEKKAMRVECLECGKKFSTSNTIDPTCPGCGGSDLDLEASLDRSAGEGLDAGGGPDTCSCGSSNLMGGPDCKCGEPQDMCGTCKKVVPHRPHYEKKASPAPVFEPCLTGQCDDCIGETDTEAGSTRCYHECHQLGDHYVGEGYVAEPEPQEQIELEEAAPDNFQSMPAGHMYKDAPALEESFCENCSEVGHDPEKDWDKCSWGTCECPCQTDGPDKEASLKKTASVYYYLNEEVAYGGRGFAEDDTGSVEASSPEEAFGKLLESSEGSRFEFIEDENGDDIGETLPWNTPMEWYGTAIKYLHMERIDSPFAYSLGQDDWQIILADSPEKIKQHQKWEGVSTKGSTSRASLRLKAEKYYLDPNAEYDWESDLVDEISGKLGEFKKEWDFTADNWEVQYEGEDKPYVEVKLVGPEVVAAQHKSKESKDWTQQKAPESAVSKQDEKTFIWQKKKEASLEVLAKGERPKIRELKDQLAKATKPADIKSLCDAIDALENRMDKEKDRKDQRREEKAKKLESAPAEQPMSSTAASKKEASHPRWIRTLLDAKPREFGYTVAEYDISTGQWKQKEIKVTDTHMRMEQEGQQYEVQGHNGWQLVPRNVFMEYFNIFNEIRQKNNFGGDVPQPADLGSDKEASEKEAPTDATCPLCFTTFSGMGHQAEEAMRKHCYTKHKDQMVSPKGSMEKQALPVWMQIVALMCSMAGVQKDPQKVASDPALATQVLSWASSQPGLPHKLQRELSIPSNELTQDVNEAFKYLEQVSLDLKKK